MSDQYDDFSLRIVKMDRGENGSPYAIIIDGAPIEDSDVAAEFSLPITEEEVEDVSQKVHEHIRERRGGGKPMPIETRMREVGEDLFKALTSNAKIAAAYHDSLVLTAGRQNNLRIRLRVDRSLANMPWEFLFGQPYGGKNKQFLALDRRISLARYVPAWYFVDRLPIIGPLKLLIIAANPHSEQYKPVDVESEVQRIRSCLQPYMESSDQNPLLSVDIIEGESTLQTLTRKLRDDQYHIIHYIGHGVYHKEQQRSFLVLEGRNRSHIEVDENMLLRVLAPTLPSLRLVVLNTCSGAVAPASEAFSGVAVSLVRNGIPAVVAMQFELSDVAAIEIAEHFYATLMKTGSVDKALTAARVELIFAYHNTPEWATPVLYLGTTNGTLFTINDEQTRRMEDLERTRRELDGQYRRANEALSRKDFQAALSMFKKIDLERPGFRDVSNNIVALQAQLTKEEFERKLAEFADNKNFRQAWMTLQAFDRLADNVKDAVSEHTRAIAAELKAEFARLETLVKKGTAAIADDELQLAEETFNEVTAIFPDFPGLGDCRTALEQTRKEWKAILDAKKAASSAEVELKFAEAKTLWRTLESASEHYGKTHLKSRNIQEVHSYAQRQIILSDQYEQFHNLLKEKHWKEAYDRSIDILASAPGYRDVEKWQKMAEEEMRKSRDAENDLSRKREKELEAFYQKLVKHHKKIEFFDVLSVYKQMKALNGGNYRDAASLATNAEKMIEIADLIKVDKSNLQKDLEKKALDALARGNLKEFFKFWQEANKKDPHYSAILKATGFTDVSLSQFYDQFANALESGNLNEFNDGWMKLFENNPQAQAFLDAIAKQNPEADSIFQEAVDRYNQRKWEEAVSACDRVLMISPFHFGALGLREEVLIINAIKEVGDSPKNHINAPMVFICYSSEDKKRAHNLYDDLQKAKILPWVDKKNLRGGDRWNDKIQTVINEEVNYFIIINSKSLTSKIEGYVHKEIDIAKQRQPHFAPNVRFIIPAIIDGEPLRQDLKEYQAVDLTNTDGLDDLIETIREDWKIRTLNRKEKPLK